MNMHEFIPSTVSPWCRKCAQPRENESHLREDKCPKCGRGVCVGCDFDGETFEAKHDEKRLRHVFDRVKSLMLDGEWRTLREIQYACGGTENSVSARLRDLRKEKFGSYTVERRRRGHAGRGLFEYRVKPKERG